MNNLWNVDSLELFASRKLRKLDSESTNWWVLNRTETCALLSNITSKGNAPFLKIEKVIMQKYQR